MRIYPALHLFLITFLLFLTTELFANNNNISSVEFFASNNTGEIDLQTAFNRLKGSEQHELQNEIINVMQKKHIEQGRFEELLGTYRMSSDQHITADNSETFITSAYQKIPNEKIFNLAKELTNTLKQESIAVFIPSNQTAIGDTILKLYKKRVV